MTGFTIGDLEIIWLNGGRFELDGGAMFGPVPKTLWQRKYPADADNCIPLLASPLLVRTAGHLVLIETGIGNKLTDKQRKNFRVREEWSVPDDLRKLGIDRSDIDHVILTHFDFDHAGGVVMQNESDGLEITFPKARHVLQKREWDDVMAPNIRNINTYWPLNNELMRNSGLLDFVDGAREVIPGVTVIHTGGHNRGHQIVRFASNGATAYHLADLLPTHAHSNPLWVMAYDNYPMETIELKQQWIKRGISEQAWFTFYHDTFMRACRFDEAGAIVRRWPEG
jgi:glyoxylase-like metal-dependent hydrolase (beta-lactamase superfamily II)